MWAYSKWSCVRVQLHNWKNGYSKITGVDYIYVLFGRGSEIHEGLSLVMKYRSIVLLRLVLGNLSNLNRYQSNNCNQYYGVYSTLVKVIHSNSASNYRCIHNQSY
jgi:hypothetical protein